MDADVFVQMIERLAFEVAVNSTMQNMTAPTGSRPDTALSALSRWFTALTPGDQEMVERAVARAAAHATLGMLCIIDGARAIEAGSSKGRLELYYINGDKKILLNDRQKEPLNDKFHWTQR